MTKIEDMSEPERQSWITFMADGAVFIYFWQKMTQGFGFQAQYFEPAHITQFPKSADWQYFCAGGCHYHRFARHYFADFRGKKTQRTLRKRRTRFGYRPATEAQG